jgi:hypothetical protein
MSGSGRSLQLNYSGESGGCRAASSGGARPDRRLDPHGQLVEQAPAVGALAPLGALREMCKWRRIYYWSRRCVLVTQLTAGATASCAQAHALL